MVKKILILIGVFLICAATIAIAQKKNLSAKKAKAAAKTSVKPADMLSMLQGNWVSLDDKKTFFKIEGNKQTDIYDRDVIDTALINFYNECPEVVNDTDRKRRSGKYLVVRVAADDLYCYNIQKISAQQLVLIYLPKGNTLRYKKIHEIKL